MINHTKLIETLVSQKAAKATMFISPKLIVRAVRRRYKYGGKKKTFSRENIEITLTIGRPNYAEREFVKQLQKSGEKFPVKRIQLKF